MSVVESKPGRITVERSFAPITKEPRKLSIRHNFIWLLFGNLVYAACQAGQLVIVARLGSQEMVGQFALGLAIGTPIVTLTGLQLRTVLVQDIKSSQDAGHYFALRIVSMVVAVALIGIIACGVASTTEVFAVVLAVGVARAFESISDLLFGFMQCRDRMDIISISLGIRGIVSTTVLGICLAATGSLVASAFAMAMISGLTLTLFDYKVASRIVQSDTAQRSVTAGRARMLLPDWNINKLSTLARRAIPLGVISVLLAVYSNTPRYFINGLLGQRDLGIYALLAAPTIAMFTVVTSLSNAIFAPLARLGASDSRTAFICLVAKATAFSAVLGGVGVALAMFWGEPTLAYLLGPGYAPHAAVFERLMYGGVFWNVSLTLGCAITATPLARVQVGVLSVAIAFTSLGCGIVSRQFGLSGVAAVVAASSLLIAIGYLAILMLYWWKADLQQTLTWHECYGR